MNKRIYSLIWNNALRQVVVASELASCKSASSSSASKICALTSRRIALVLATLLALCASQLIKAADTNGAGEAHPINESTATYSPLSKYYTYAEMANAQPLSTPPGSTCAGIAGENSNYGSLACGYNATANGGYATAVGYAANASGARSTALGFKANTSTSWGNLALGDQASASGNYAAAIGFLSSAAGTYAVAIGSRSQASTIRSVAIGADASASHPYSVAIGSHASASTPGGIAI